MCFVQRKKLCSMSDQLDEQESGLVRDCAGRLASEHSRNKRLQEDLQRKCDEYMNLHFKYTQALQRVCDLEEAVRQTHLDSDLLRNQLAEWQVKHQLMAAQVSDFRDKYDECLTILAETQRELKKHKKEVRWYQRRTGNRTHLVSPGTVDGFETDESPIEYSRSISQSSNSLASELKQSALRDSRGET
ncbi:Trafficking protein, kinesin binding [Cichlidogyrus casuarinus]|uniref:Trafficking protein, kinesin binding n=1 Tax=Cichlidogyrus casuarinus TaxID=1844966 RepID=A0ABD2QJF4_9PLAT